MPKTFKIILSILAAIFIVAILIVKSLPKPKLTYYERLEIANAINRINAELPRRIGTIGQFDSITFNDDILTYNFSDFGDVSIDDFYTSNYNEIGELMKYGVITMNGQCGMGTYLSSLLKDKGLELHCKFVTPSKKSFEWGYSGEELLSFIREIQISPTKALYLIIDTHIKLANLSLPISAEDMGKIQSITNNSIANTLTENDRLLRIMHDNDNVIFVVETNEKEIGIKDIKDNLSNELFTESFAELLSEDADVVEFINLLVLSHSKLTYRMINIEASDSVDITIPYDILKKNCKITGINLI